MVPNLVLGADNERDLTSMRLCYLSELQAGTGVSRIRCFIRRI